MLAVQELLGHLATLIQRETNINQAIAGPLLGQRCTIWPGLYQCPSCNARYYRKTSRNLAIRCREQIGVTKTGYTINNNSSAVYNHSSTTGHPVSPEDFSIIISTSNNIDFLIIKSVLILRYRPTLNSQTSSIQLTLF